MGKYVTHNNLTDNLVISEYHKDGSKRLTIKGSYYNIIDLTAEQWDDIVDFVINRGQAPK